MNSIDSSTDSSIGSPTDSSIDSSIDEPKPIMSKINILNDEKHDEQSIEITNNSENTKTDNNNINDIYHHDVNYDYDYDTDYHVELLANPEKLKGFYESGLSELTNGSKKSKNTKSNNENMNINIDDKANNKCGYDYNTDYHVELLANPEKLKGFYKSGFTSKSANRVSTPNVDLQARLINMTLYMDKYGIKKFNLEKYVKCVNIIKILINDKSNSEKYILAKIIIEFLYTYVVLPKNIILSSNICEFQKKIKDFCISKGASYYDMALINHEKIKNICEKDSRDVLIISDMEHYIDIYQYNTNIIILNEYDSSIDLEKFNIVFNYLQFNNGTSTNINTHANYVTNTVFEKILKKFENQCFMVTQKNKSLEWYTLDKDISTIKSLNNSDKIHFPSKNSVNFNKQNSLQDSTESTKSTNSTEFIKTPKLFSCEQKLIKNSSDNSTNSSNSGDSSSSSDPSNSNNSSNSSNSSNSNNSSDSGIKSKSSDLDDSTNLESSTNNNLTNSYSSTNSTNSQKLHKSKNSKNLIKLRKKKSTGSIYSSSSNSSLSNSTISSMGNKKCKNKHKKIIKMNVGKDIKIKIYY